MSYVVGITCRNQYNERGPLRHIHTHVQASRWGRNHRAACGTSITPYSLRENGKPVPFDPDHPRACHRCVAWFRGRTT